MCCQTLMFFTQQLGCGSHLQGAVQQRLCGLEAMYEWDQRGCESFSSFFVCLSSNLYFVQEFSSYLIIPYSVSL